jgi:Trk K+ transport system NAD-binding subunit
VPSDRLATFLTDRVEGIAQVRKYLRAMGAEDLPILVIAIEHDEQGLALMKQPKSPTGMAKRQRRRP